jgi:hypothetical protein
MTMITTKVGTPRPYAWHKQRLRAEIGPIHMSCSATDLILLDTGLSNRPPFRRDNVRIIHRHSAIAAWHDKAANAADQQ